MGWPALAVGLYVASADSAPRLRPPPRSVSVPVPPHPCRQRGPSARSVAGAQTGAERVPWCRVHHAGDWWRHRPPRRRPPAGPLRRVRSRSVPVVAVCRVLAIREFFVPQLPIPQPVCEFMSPPRLWLGVFVLFRSLLCHQCLSRSRI